MMKNRRGNIRTSHFICLIIAVCVAAVYGKVWNAETINIDDPSYVTENRHVTAGLTWRGLAWAFRSVESSNWHPITWLSHMLDCELFGSHSGAHHLVNVFFHLINTFLLFFFLHRTTGDLWSSGVAAIIFTVHPLNVESVAWIAERKNLLGMMFWLLTCLMYVHYLKQPCAARYLLTLASFSVGLMAKPVLVTLPVVLLLLDFWPLKRLNFDGYTRSRANPIDHRTIFRLILEKIPFVILSAGSSAVTIYAQAKSGAVTPLAALPVLPRIINAVISYLGYIQKIFWPENLAIVYPHPVTPSMKHLFIPATILIGISLFCLAKWKRQPYLAVGWLWYVVALLPTIGLIQVGVQSMADRYAYIPMIGFLIALVWGCNYLADQYLSNRKSLLLCAALSAAACMWISFGQVGHWQSSLTLFEHSLSVTKKNYVAHNGLGLALARIGRSAEAAEQYKKALAIQPEFGEAHYNLGVSCFLQDRLDEAIYHFSEAVRIDPEHSKSYNNKGALLAQTGKLDDAIGCYAKAIRLDGENVDAHRNMAGAMMEKGDYRSAILHYRRVLDINPDDKYAHNNIGIVLGLAGEAEAARFHFSEALRMDDKFTEALHNLALENRKETMNGRSSSSKKGQRSGN